MKRLIRVTADAAPGEYDVNIRFSLAIEYTCEQSVLTNYSVDKPKNVPQIMHDFNKGIVEYITNSTGLTLIEGEYPLGYYKGTWSFYMTGDFTAQAVFDKTGKLLNVRTSHHTDEDKERVARRAVWEDLISVSVSALLKPISDYNKILEEAKLYISRELQRIFNERMADMVSDT